MGSMRTVPAQEEALAYLCRAAWRYERPLRVGGHSKGGNLAVYAAMNAPEEGAAAAAGRIQQRRPRLPRRRGRA